MFQYFVCACSIGSSKTALCPGSELSLLAFLISTIILCLFDLILYVPVNNFSVMPGWVFLG